MDNELNIADFQENLNLTLIWLRENKTPSFVTNTLLDMSAIFIDKLSSDMRISDILKATDE